MDWWSFIAGFITANLLFLAALVISALVAVGKIIGPRDRRSDD